MLYDCAVVVFSTATPVDMNVTTSTKDDRFKRIGDSPAPESLGARQTMLDIYPTQRTRF